MSPVEILFWACAVMLAYIYAGYPLMVWMLARFRPRPVQKDAFAGTVSVILVAHNESARLANKLSNLLASSAAGKIIEVFVGSDGSTDSTPVIASSHPDLRVHAVSFEQRRGKPGVINDLVAKASGEILLFLDARQDLAHDALERMLANFADPGVGVVSGELVFLRDTETGTAGEGIGFYWTYEKLIRGAEARYRSVPGATGAIYAIRRDLFRPIPAQTILDDVVIPMQAVEQGFRCILERGAEAYDRPSVSTSRESIRKRRTIAGCAQLIVAHPQWLLPWRNPIWWEYCSHKLLRLASPLLLLGVGLANLWLMKSPLYSVLLSLQFAMYVTALAGWMSQQLGRKSAVFGPSLMFVSLNATTLAALWDALCGRFHAAWRKTA